MMADEPIPIADAAELWQADVIEGAMAERDRLAGIIARAAQYLAEVERVDGLLARAERRLTEVLALDLARTVRAAVANCSIAREILAEARPEDVSSGD
jgi:hypothetical protein